MKRIVVMLASCLLAGAGYGSDDDAAPLWELRGVLFAQSFPTFIAADEQNLTVLPLPYLVYRGRFLRLGEDLDDWAEGRLLHSDRLKLSISVDATFAEESDKIAARLGMPDIDFLAEIGPEVEWHLAGDPKQGRELKLNLPIRAAVSFDGLDASGRGVVFSPELEYATSLSARSGSKLSLRLSPLWASEQYADYFYEVAPEFATPEREIYAASRGYLGSELKVGFERELSRRWRFIGSVRVWINEGARNAESPLFRRNYGSGVRLALVYTFLTSERTVRD